MPTPFDSLFFNMNGHMGPLQSEKREFGGFLRVGNDLESDRHIRSPTRIYAGEKRKARGVETRFESITVVIVFAFKLQNYYCIKYT